MVENLDLIADGAFPSAVWATGIELDLGSGSFLSERIFVFR